eukprot:CAMPEP_0204895090 /NCGR_PEP_ID=MMETSP1349-20130617/33821_1 /ASSEMBLY_ACC=CAM_ASM_000710 /TAXON_ID=215587 /ORGANISM="Aplanochytrium stocchinoi, Strain GSBS06" /LENGTH=88 /DNA_ID=CAMNT_0052062401 /DNA_START=864 /DNA_END=1130 /DNA_ORIENTATION=-
MGLAVMVSRLGGMIAPFASQKLVEDGRQKNALVIIALFYIVAAAAALLLPVETRGRGLGDNEYEMADMKSLRRISIHSECEDDAVSQR